MSEDLNHPYRIVAELPEGGGVWVEHVCVLCGEVNEAISCPICARVFCIELCFGVHFTARDTHDAPDKIDAFLRTEKAHEILDTMLQGQDCDWRHGLSCDNCRPDLREVVIQLLQQGAKIAVSDDACE